jgi:hypothetical protein
MFNLVLPEPELYKNPIHITETALILTLMYI